MKPYEMELDSSTRECLRELGNLAEDWGAEWQEEGRGGRLTLPVLAGVRRGLLSGHVRVEARKEGSRLTFQPQEEFYRVQRPVVVFLLLALCGALAILAAPLFPVLVPLLPLSALLMLAAWLFIVSSLRNSGPEEFFESLELELARDPED